jgi:hypothetical protein
MGDYLMSDYNESFKSANFQFVTGGALTDSQLVLLISHYQRLIRDIELLDNPEFKLFENVMRDRLRALEEFYYHRIAP